MALTKQVQDKLTEIETKYESILAQINDPEFSSDYQNYMQAAKAKNEIEPVVTAYRNYRRVLDDIPVAEEMDMAEELELLKHQREEFELALRMLLLPVDPNDNRNVIMEIRAAAGGEEAKLFAGELYRLYSRYAERKKWGVELIDIQETGIGGVQEVTFEIKGQGAYSQLKFEGGVHRVQRVPVTESSGRIQTSTVTVAVMPEAEEVDIHIDEKDVEMDIYHASSAGGQNVQKVATAIRLVHKPTGLIVTCQDERSQLQNKIKAYTVLRTRLYELKLKQSQEEQAGNRRSQVGTGERAEKIRTYNFPDGRVSDHRVGVTLYNVPGIMDGDIQQFIDALIILDQTQKMHDSSDS